MAKRIRRVALFLVIYAVLFWIGFRTGEMCSMGKERVRVQEIVEYIMNEKKTKDELRGKVSYYVVYEDEKGVISDFSEVPENNIFIKLFFNEKLKHLLKARKIQIYNSNGDRLY